MELRCAGGRRRPILFHLEAPQRRVGVQRARAFLGSLPGFLAEHRSEAHVHFSPWLPPTRRGPPGAQRQNWPTSSSQGAPQRRRLRCCCCWCCVFAAAVETHSLPPDEPTLTVSSCAARVRELPRPDRQQPANRRRNFSHSD